MSRVAGLPALQQALNTAVAKAFLYASNPQPRREALPFSLSFVCWLERRVMSADSSLADKYGAASLLCALWGPCAGLTLFGLLHPPFKSSSSRAAWFIFSRTKTSKIGMCWGALLHGLTGSASACWVWTALLQWTLKECLTSCLCSHLGLSYAHT